MCQGIVNVNWTIGWLKINEEESIWVAKRWNWNNYDWIEILRNDRNCIDPSTLYVLFIVPSVSKSRKRLPKSFDRYDTYDCILSHGWWFLESSSCASSVPRTNERISALRSRITSSLTMFSVGISWKHLKLTLLAKCVTHTQVICGEDIFFKWRMMSSEELLSHWRHFLLEDATFGRKTNTHNASDDANLILKMCIMCSTCFVITTCFRFCTYMKNFVMCLNHIDKKIEMLYRHMKSFRMIFVGIINCALEDVKVNNAVITSQQFCSCSIIMRCFHSID